MCKKNKVMRVGIAGNKPEMDRTRKHRTCEATWIHAFKKACITASVFKNQWVVEAPGETGGPLRELLLALVARAPQELALLVLPHLLAALLDHAAQIRILSAGQWKGREEYSLPAPTSTTWWWREDWAWR
jgi:hypothetical protein